MFVPLTDLLRFNAQTALPANDCPKLASSPVVPQLHLFDTEFGPHALVSNGSRIFKLGADAFTAITDGIASPDSHSIDETLASLGIDNTPYIDDDAPATPPVRALSLAIAQKCNLGCTYCYAQEGEFGAAPKNMTMEMAASSVDLLFRDAKPGERINLSFLGGEPLVNRSVLIAATLRAARLADETGAKAGFSITTNGTLLTSGDAEFFEYHGFAVTISLDGVEEVHDRLRPFKDGHGSYKRIIERAAILLDRQRKMQVSARVTVTPSNLGMRETLDELIGIGFHSVGFSPMLSSPSSAGEMTRSTLATMLEQMMECGEEFERQIIAGRRYPFLNMVNAMQEIHKGTHRPYPCGAGA
ncbi:MAG: radical SAM protein, partial [Acidobacteriota bacterium]|nr:radical SAM protein [Acidobacteriota bacterium]